MPRTSVSVDYTGLRLARLIELVKHFRDPDTGDRVDAVCMAVVGMAQDHRAMATSEQRLQWLTLGVEQPSPWLPVDRQDSAYFQEKARGQPERVALQERALKLCRKRKIPWEKIVPIGERARDGAYVALVGGRLRRAIGQLPARPGAAFRAALPRVLDRFEAVADVTTGDLGLGLLMRAAVITDYDHATEADLPQRLRAAVTLLRETAPRLRRLPRPKIATRRPGRPGRKTARRQALEELKDLHVPYAARILFLRAWGLRSVTQ